MVLRECRKHYRNAQDLYAAHYPDREQKSHMAFKRLADRFCRFGTVKQTRVKRRPIVNQNNAPKCEVRYGPRLRQHRQKLSGDRLPISCSCWNDNSGMHLAANSGPNSGRQHLFSAQQRANAVPNSGFLTSRIVCRAKSDTWPSNVPSMSPNLALLLSELDAIVTMTIGLV